MCITKEIECQALCCCYENSFTTRHDNWSCLNQARSHSTKISDNSSSNWMKQKVSRNRLLKILVNLSKLFFFRNLEILEMSCSIWHLYPVWIGPSSSSNDWKLQNVGESTLPLRCVHVRVFYRLLVLHKKVRNAFLENCGRLGVPRLLWTFA